MKRYNLLLASICISVATSLAEAPDGYYDSCEGFGGQTLITKLSAVISNHKDVGYDGLWRVYETSDVDADGKVWDMYSTKRWVVGKERCGNYSLVGDCINREHSFPKSWFSKGSPMKSDAFHVYPTDGKVNGQRSNYPYGECAGGTTLPSNGSVKALGRKGTSTFPGYSGEVFEPVDEYKGDFARSYFYMATCYNSRIKSWNSDMLAGNSYPAYKQWAIDLLLKWHRQDPVSEKEIKRNDAVYAHQKNRNPYIDHPELAEYVWGNKKNEKWYANGDPTPAIVLPANNSAVDFGIVATNYTLSRSISVKTANLTQPLTVSVSSPDFKASTTTISAAQANAGTSFSLTVKAATAGRKTAVVKLSSSEVSATINISAEAIDGIPALQAENVDIDGFTARWMSLGDAETYSLNVMKNGVSIAGYPRQVNAEVEEYDVEGLEESTTYTYQLSSANRTSNIISVTTATPIPAIQYVGTDEFALSADPGSPSEPAEVWIYSEYIYEPIIVAVEAPFEVSTDMSTWSRSITLDPDEERFYLRIATSEVGNYETFVSLSSGDYIHDDGHASATVRDSSTPWFVEDFERGGDKKYDSYEVGYYSGSNMEWALKNAGIWKSDTKKHGDYSLRLGKTSASAIESKSAKPDGIGTVSFHASRWSESDGNMTISVEYSADANTWTKAGSITVDSDSFLPYSLTVNAGGSNYIRLVQTAGARGNIDDISVSDYKQSAVEAIDSYRTWTAYSHNGSLVIDNRGPERPFAVYSIDGVTLFEGSVGASLTLSLPANLYIVADSEDARRVVVK